MVQWMRRATGKWVYCVEGSERNRFRKVIIHNWGKSVPSKAPVRLMPLRCKHTTLYQAKFRVTDVSEMKKCTKLLRWLHKKGFRYSQTLTEPDVCSQKEPEFLRILCEHLMLCTELYSIMREKD